MGGKRGERGGGRRTWKQNAVVAQIKSSDVEAVERIVCYAKREARERAKKMEKKFYEGLTGGLGRLTMYTRRYHIYPVCPAASGPMDRRPSDDVQRPTFLRWCFTGPEVLAPRWAQSHSLDLVRHIRPSPGASRGPASSSRAFRSRLAGRVVKVILPGVKATRARRKNNMALLPSRREVIALSFVIGI